MEKEWINIETKQVFKNITAGIHWILVNTNGIICKDESGKNSLNDEIVNDVAKRYGMEKKRIYSTFKDDIKKGITDRDIDKETGLRISDRKSRKLHDLKKISEVIKNKTLQVDDTPVSRQKGNKMKDAQNIILYGPPGT